MKSILYTQTIHNMSQTVVYDKVKYHYEGDFPQDLDRHQGCVHIGMFLGWLCDKHFISAEMKEDFPAEIDQFLERKITGPHLLRITSGALVSDMLSEEGNAFTEAYFNRNGGKYLDDYADALGGGIESLYHVEDTWRNYELLKERIDARHLSWERGRVTV